MSSLFPRFLSTVERWFSQTPERSLEIAYEAALSIQAIENQHFSGDKISVGNSRYGPTVYAHFEADLDRNLEIIKLRLAEYRNSRSVVDIYQQVSQKKKSKYFSDYPTNGQSLGSVDSESLIIDKLKFIDEVIAKYTPDQVIYPLQRDNGAKSIALPEGAIAILDADESKSVPLKGELKLDPNQPRFEKKSTTKDRNLASQTSFLPRSILRTLDRLKRDLDPDAETDIVQDFRKSKTRTV